MKRVFIIMSIVTAFFGCEYSNKNIMEKGYESYSRKDYYNADYWFSKIPETSDYFEEADSMKLKIDSANRARIAEIDGESRREGIGFQQTVPDASVMPYGSKYSSSAVETCKNRVDRWISMSYVKIEANDEVYISPELWNAVDFDGKKEVMATIQIYTEVFEERGENTTIEFKNKQSGKTIASWSKWSGFEIE